MALISTLVSAIPASAGYIQFNSGYGGNQLASGSPANSFTPGGAFRAGVGVPYVQGVVQDGRLVVNPHMRQPGVFTVGTPAEGTITTCMDSNA